MRYLYIMYYHFTDITNFKTLKERVPDFYAFVYSNKDCLKEMIVS